jgi:hypothetical protein
MNFPNYDQLYTIVEAIANAISRKKADLVPNELTREEMENLHNLLFPTIVITETVQQQYVDYEPERYVDMRYYFNSDNLLYISRIEYQVANIEDTTWYTWDPETKSLGGNMNLRLTLIGNKDYISANPDAVDEFVNGFRNTLFLPA